MPTLGAPLPESSIYLFLAFTVHFLAGHCPCFMLHCPALQWFALPRLNLVTLLALTLFSSGVGRQCVFIATFCAVVAPLPICFPDIFATCLLSSRLSSFSLALCCTLSVLVACLYADSTFPVGFSLHSRYLVATVHASLRDSPTCLAMGDFCLAVIVDSLAMARLDIRCCYIRYARRFVMAFYLCLRQHVVY